MSISIARAKSLCTANELLLVKASGSKEIGTLSAAQLRQKVSRTRSLRDKWRDLAERQRRTSQAKQKARQTDENARSGAKAELFAEVLSRFETQLAKDDGTARGVKTKRITKKARSREHRATRADVRSALKEKKRKMGAKRGASSQSVQSSAGPVASKSAAKSPVAAAKTAKSATAKAKAAKSKATTTSTALRGAVSGGKSAARSKKRRPETMTEPSSLSQLAALQGLSTNKRKQGSATTAAKQARIQKAGIVRIQKHTSARNKRRQASRDSK